MEKRSIYNWKNNFLGNKSKLYKQDSLIGSLESNDWTLDANVSIRSDQYRFINKGLFNPYTEIRNKYGELIGDIEYNNWTGGATISLVDRKYKWSTRNMWLSSWKIEDEQGELVEINPSVMGNGGTIESKANNELLLSISLYLQKRTTVMYSMIALIPVFTILLF
ncbi:MAG: hypothetical protein K0R59_1484 [Sphingobacterium sp.]|jgi:hypothetical protein|uniref:hypothetical protein n=1 Tax=Sphingobacterium sp. CZ-UAM TaxID=1933868 RepID=UPI000984ACAA|nr:hypothetical protein [Sphingobacterium sp. CZ-UAM]MDF2516188.1 hypothetical protein [Sphingobacterium sp.]OOG17117.1 hypothetical protein BWD42_16780 [Sphingobacterium sp. CZ-UAM]